MRTLKKSVEEADARAEARADARAGTETIANGGWTDLHWAVMDGDTHAVRSLTESGADVVAKAQNGWTALHLAANRG